VVGKLQEIGSALRAPFLRHSFDDRGIRHLVAHRVRAPQSRRVGHRFDVERQDGRHAGNTPVDR